MAVKIKTSCGRGLSKIFLGLAYLRCNYFEPSPSREMKKLVAGCRAEGSHLVISCDVNTHHTTWGSSSINRGETVFNFIMANDLDIMNKGNKPSFVTFNRQEVVDVTVATFYAGNFIEDWHVTEEVSCSDHRYIQFNITGIDHLVEFIIIHTGLIGSLLEMTWGATCMVLKIRLLTL
jgi:hypothetical protein